MVTDFLRGVPRGLLACFRLRFIVPGIAAGLVTYLLVHFGFDWWYFEHTRSMALFAWALPAAIIGFFVPILLPVCLYMWGELRRRPRETRAGVLVAQAGIVGWMLSALLKAVTGRLQPEFYTHLSNIDTSHIFNFGFLRHGIFWGWPSSHTTVAVAMSVALMSVYKNRLISSIAIIYAAYIAIGVSVSIHWFSDAVAGVVFGIIAGVAVSTRRPR